MSRQIEISNHYRQACEAYQANLIKRQRDSFWEISYVRYALALMICTLCGNNFFEQKYFDMSCAMPIIFQSFLQFVKLLI